MASALRIRNLGKLYNLGGGGAGNLRETLSEFIFRRRQSPATSRELWALQDVSIDISKGEVVGIIGRNGAGKSTLLKVLSRITSPTRGEVQVFGSIASLLEVGTGFHPELTGRENVFLNGSILGMSRARIKSRFDEIVAFAEIERFLDTPVKHYSSGMYVRLAFAVAAHLDSEILLLDEVLAVGDVGFQKKCLAKMDDVAGHGRTVLFVSHTMTAIRQLCPRTILIDKGQVVADGPTPETLRSYSDRLRGQTLSAESHLKERLEGLSGAVRFTSFRMENAEGKESYDFREGETMRVRIHYQAYADATDLCFYFALTSEQNGEIVTSVRYPLSEKPVKKGETGTAVIEFPQAPLMPREYHPYAWLGSNDGLPYDRINYYLTNCPPVIVSPRTHTPSQLDGYFTMPSRLLRA